MGRDYTDGSRSMQADPVDVLTSVARLVAEAPTLREVVGGVAATLRVSIPFERLHMLRLDRADSFVLYIADESGEVEVTKHLVGDPATPLDAVDESTRSRIVCTIRQGSRVHGALWLTSSRADVFCTAHQKLMDSVVDLLGLAFEHDAIIEREKLRRERIDSLRRLLQTMAGALDIRHIFDKVSEVVRGGLPHDMLVITSWGADGASFSVYAMAGATAEPDFFAPQALTGDDLAQLRRDAYVVHDAEAEVPSQSLRGKLFRRFGVRSALRVLMPLGTEVFGSLFFLARQTDRFSEDDIDFARRVADHLALALSHERLAEAARSQAESRETAARLEAQVATLTRELEARTGQRRVVGQSKQWKDVLAHAARVAHTETTVLLTPRTRAFVAGASEQERGLALVVGSDGVALRIEGQEAVSSVADGSPALTTAAMDVLDREWVCSVGRLWVRDPGRELAWRPVWHDPTWQAPFVSMIADAGMVVAMTADGAILEGRASWRSVHGHGRGSGELRASRRTPLRA